MTKGLVVLERFTISMAINVRVATQTLVARKLFRLLVLQEKHEFF